MSDLSYKDLRENFIERDENAYNDFQREYCMAYSDGARMELRLQFTEQRVKDLCQVVAKLTKKLESLEQENETNTTVST